MFKNLTYILINSQGDGAFSLQSEIPTTKVLKRRNCALVHSGQFYMISFAINRKLKKKENTKRMQILAHI